MRFESRDYVICDSLPTNNHQPTDMQKSDLTRPNPRLMAEDITPPGSVFEPPLTPPPTEEKSFSTRAERVIGHFEGHRKGHRPGPWIECSLSPVDYSQVLHALESKKSLRRYVEDKVR